ncbi:mast cell-expressed membrane protein 1 isoform X1 [Marmota marmota marmota]|uniref:mast cell-expressed membrane protein 1 isoform X1 n=1 Tax=Marmota marmota marmota TaxID=9994 RepID=UPI002092E74B|nr:mast cell-expressed membrane protein 1 isoform X1 [Marmota marmota marmota]
MQAAAFRDKKGGNTGDHKDTHDPDYENITLTFRNRDQPRDSHLAPMNQVSAQPRPSSDTAQVPAWLHRAIMSLFVLLALTFLFFITLSILMLLKNSEMSRELLSLKRELWNATNAAQEVQEEQRMHWRAILQNSGEAMKGISEIKIKVQSGNEKLKTVAAEITQINKNTQKILEELGKKMSTQSTPQ